MLIQRAEVAGQVLDVRLQNGQIAELGPDLDAAPGSDVIDARGGALIPGLHDHHLHLLALAAARRSVACGPPDVRSRAELAAALHAGAARAKPGEWIRGIGYHESVAGELDRGTLDALVRNVPVRIQHRSGALWMLNSAAVEALGLDFGELPDGVEHDDAGRVMGRLFRLDRWLQDRLESSGHGSPAIDLSSIGAELARAGVTGLTDATPGNEAAALETLAAAVETGALPQRLVVMGGPALPASPAGSRVERGAFKVLLDDVGLPDLDSLIGQVRRAHADDRGVAFHCVTRTQLVFAAAALEASGASELDRIEHAAIAPPELVGLLRGLGVSVVTQPNFIRERGDAYATDVEPRDLPWLYRCRGFLESGVPLGAGTDAPFGNADPWLAIRAAVDRRSEQGLVLGEREGLSPERALALFTSPANAPGAAARRVALGEPADLCLLIHPWSKARDRLAAEDVRATFCDGRRIA